MKQEKYIFKILCFLALFIIDIEESFSQGTSIGIDTVLVQENRHVNSALQLVQGRVPGLSIYNDRDPNGRSSFRLRGLNHFQNQRPLIVVDGIFFSNVNLIDPNEIKSVNILKSVNASSKYGIYGSNGVIEINTKGADLNTGSTSTSSLKIDYSTYLAFSDKSNEMEVLNREQYLTLGGNDLGADTDWQDEVSRTARSQNHNFMLSGSGNKFSYYVSGAFSDAEGILKESEFERFMIRSGIQHSTLDDKADIRINFYNSGREEKRSFVEAFRYAVVYFPTAPIRFENGEFFQVILFDNFNPVAITEQNLNYREYNETGFSASLDYEILNNLVLASSYSKALNSRFVGQFYPSISFFRGINRNGFVFRGNYSNEYTASTNSLLYTVNGDNFQLIGSVGYNYRDEKLEAEEVEISNLPTDFFGYNIPYNVEGTNVTRFSPPTIKNSTTFLGGQLRHSLVDIDVRIRRENFNVLGNGDDFELFSGIDASLDLKQIFQINGTQKIEVYYSGGKNALHPGFYGAALDQPIFRFDLGGVNLISIADPNDELELATVKERSLGLDVSLLGGHLDAGFEYFSRKTSDVIAEVNIPADESLTGALSKFDNVMGFRSTGFELYAGYSSDLTRKFRYSAHLNISSYSIILDGNLIERQMRGIGGAPGQGSLQLIRLSEGEEIGQIWGPVFDRVGDNGEAIMKDLNGDGLIITNQGDALDENADFKVLGKAYPDFEFGWLNEFRLSGFSLDLFFRGAFGHSLVNINRLFYEANDAGIFAYNRVSTDKSISGLMESRFSSLYVERADFVKLDYISFGYLIEPDFIHPVKSIKIFSTVENVFTITNYTGVSPEPVFDDYGPTDNGGFISNVASTLSPGIDRRNNYLPARTWLVGVQLSF